MAGGLDGILVLQLEGLSMREGFDLGANERLCLSVVRLTKRGDLKASWIGSTGRWGGMILCLRNLAAGPNERKEVRRSITTPCGGSGGPVSAGQGRKIGTARMRKKHTKLKR